MIGTEGAVSAVKTDNSGEAQTLREKVYFASRGESGLADRAGDAADMPVSENNAEAQNAAGEEPQSEQNEKTERQQRKTVPYAALRAEREGHKKTRAELQKMQAQALAWQRELAHFPSAAAEQRQTDMMPSDSAYNAAQADRSMPPDPREDFLGFARWQGQEISRLQQELTAQQRQAEERQRHEAAEAAIMREWDNALGEARGALPDIDDAMDFLEEARLNQLRALAGIDKRFSDPAFCEKQICGELRDIVIATFQQGKNPAEAVYALAQAYGFGRNETAHMDRLQQASQAARSLTAGSAKQAGDPLLLETIADLPEAEFVKWYENNKSSFRALFGG